MLKISRQFSSGSGNVQSASSLCYLRPNKRRPFFSPSFRQLRRWNPSIFCTHHFTQAGPLHFQMRRLEHTRAVTGDDADPRRGGEELNEEATSQEGMESGTILTIIGVIIGLSGLCTYFLFAIFPNIPSRVDHKRQKRYGAVNVTEVRQAKAELAQDFPDFVDDERMIFLYVKGVLGEHPQRKLEFVRQFGLKKVEGWEKKATGTTEAWNRLVSLVPVIQESSRDVVYSTPFSMPLDQRQKIQTFFDFLMGCPEWDTNVAKNEEQNIVMHPPAPKCGTLIRAPYPYCHRIVPTGQFCSLNPVFAFLYYRTLIQSRIYRHGNVYTVVDRPSHLGPWMLGADRRVIEDYLFQPQDKVSSHQMMLNALGLRVDHPHDCVRVALRNAPKQVSSKKNREEEPLTEVESTAGTATDVSTTKQQLETLLKRHRCALLPSFTVYEDFLNLAKDAEATRLALVAEGFVTPTNPNRIVSRLHSAPKGAAVGNHGMILLGQRTDPVTNKRHYLLQNWWPALQFIDVDEDYLFHCAPEAIFAKKEAVDPKGLTPDDTTEDEEMWKAPDVTFRGVGVAKSRIGVDEMGPFGFEVCRGVFKSKVLEVPDRPAF